MTAALRRQLGLTIALLALPNAHATFADVYSFRVVAQNGDPAPGSIAGWFTSFGYPYINASGQVAFQAATDGLIADTGMWMTKFDDPQSLALIIGEDYPVPGAPPDTHFGVFIDSIHHPLLNDSGDVGFSAPVDLGPVITGLFRMIDGTITKVALPNDPTPGAGPGTTFESMSNLEAFNDDGLMVFKAHLQGPGVNLGNDEVMCLTWFGGVNIVIREGNGAPGLPGTTFGNMFLRFPLLADDGQIAFDVPLNGVEACEWSRWRGWPGSLELFAKDGDPTPLGGLLSSDYNDFWTMGLTGDGACFMANVETRIGLAPAIWRADGGDLEPIAAAGQLGPIGIYEEFPEYTPPETAKDGAVAFPARFSGVPDAEDTAIVLRRPGEAAEILVREDDYAYGFGAFVEIDDLMSFGTPSQMAITNSHWLVFSAQVRGFGINATNNQGWWAIDPDGEIHLIVRKGQAISFEGEPARQVGGAAIMYDNGPNSGRRGGINERGDVALTLYFTNGDEAIVVAQFGPNCTGDLNGNGAVGAEDLAIMLGAWGTTGPVGTEGDVDWDGDSDAEDLAVLLGAWGPCPL